MPDLITASPRGGGDRLLDRERELVTLHGVIDDAVLGDGRIAVVEGPPGIGKSRLLAEARAAACERMQVLAGRGGELEREFPFGLVRQLFEPLLVDRAARERLLAGPAAAASPVFDTVGDESGGDASFSSLHGLYWLTLNVAAGRPLLLVVDDLHWGDRASLRYFAYLARRLEGSHVLIVAGLRPAEQATDVSLLGEIVADPDAILIRPGHLSREATRELVRDRLGADADDDFAAACFASTGGNPLLLRELLRSLASEGVTPTAAQAHVVREIGPEAISRTVLVRLARLVPEATTVARAAAVLGDTAQLRTVAELAGLSEQSTGDAIGALTRAEVLRSEPPIGFVHPLVRDSVYRDLAPGERELQHARAAEVLAAAGAPTEQVAAHLLHVPPRGDANVSATLAEAAREARRSGAPESSAALLRRALEEPPPRDLRGRMLFELSAAEEMFDGPAAVDHLRSAYDLLDDPRERAQVSRLLVRTLLFVAPPDVTARAACEARTELPEELADERNALEAYELIAQYWGTEDPPDLDRLERYRQGGVGSGLGGKALASITALHWAITGGPRDECIALALEALDGGTFFTEDDGVPADNGVLALYALDALLIADYDPAADILDSAFAASRSRGSLLLNVGVTLWRGLAKLLRGDVGQAVTLLKDAREMHRLWCGRDIHASYMAAFLMDALREQGDLEAAREVLEATGDAPGTGDGARIWRHSRAQLLLAEGRTDEALGAAEDFARLVGPDDNPAARPWRSMKATVLHRLGRADEAVALAAVEVELARRWGAPSFTGRALRVLGTLEGEGGITHLREAVEILSGSTARLEEAKARAALGAAQRRTGEVTEAREMLRSALDLADRCGARGLVEDVTAELNAAGARPRTKAAGGVGSLTASERRIVALAADGATNRDIAQALYVTPKTVEVHLTNAYRKLGVRSRRELAGALE